MVRQRDVIVAMRRAAALHGVEFRLELAGARHDLYRVGQVLVPVPRHRELGPGLMHAIHRQCAAALGEGWWR